MQQLSPAYGGAGSVNPCKSVAKNISRKGAKPQLFLAKAAKGFIQRAKNFIRVIRVPNHCAAIFPQQ